jgi:hypothetical protein
MKKMLLFFCTIVCCATTHAQLTIYQNLDQSGTSATCVVSTIYKGSAIPGGLNNSIKSISLQQGYMATLAANEDGTGESFNYIAVVSDVTVNLAYALQDRISFIRVLPYNNPNKRGVCNTTDSIPRILNGSWFYDWGNGDVSNPPTREYVLMTWGQNATSDANLNTWVNRAGVTTLLSFNEPDNTSQSNITVTNAITPYKRGLKAGFRTGSPACKEENYDNWLLDFTNQLKVDTTRVDFIAIHWYDWGNWSSTMNATPNANDVLNRFKAYINNVWNLYKKPIWITEFNANVNRGATVQSQFMALALPYLDSDPRVERYSYFFETNFPPLSGGNSGTITALGQQYANHVSVPSLTANIVDTRSAYPQIISWNASSLTGGGITTSNFTPNSISSDLTAVAGFTRGSGLTTSAGANLAGYWGSNSFSTATTPSTGISSNKFLIFKLQSTNNKTVSYKTIDSFKIRIAADGPIKYQLDYQLNNGTFTSIATLTGPTRTAANFELTPVNLENISGLQNVPSSTVVTFRLTPYDASGTGVFYIGDGTPNQGADFNITGSFATASPLPVTLVNFKSQLFGDKVKLNWETKAELNFSHFILERATNPNDFKAIATIRSNGIAAGSQYQFDDFPATTEPVYYYRLKLVDNDGQFKYSNMLIERFDGKQLFAVYPTLVSGNYVNVMFEKTSGKAEIKVIGMDGKILHAQKLQTVSGIETVDVSQLKAGMYVLVLHDANGTKQAKFMKQ